MAKTQCTSGKPRTIVIPNDPRFRFMVDGKDGVSEVNLDEIVGSVRITVTPRGFWGESISLYISMPWPVLRPRPAKSFSVRLQHSAGGRNREEIGCDLEASRFFADAMNALAELGRKVPTEA